MPISYWLDANVFIEAHKGPYAFDIAPGFWKALERLARSGIVRSSIKVRAEIVGRKDELEKWVCQIETTSGLFARPDRLVQKDFGEIAQFVQQTYSAAHSSKFLGDADPWVIAHAQVAKGTVVTLEMPVASASSKIRIPNVCRRFKVPYLNTYALLRTLGVRL
jgi:hypothetical protein